MITSGSIILLKLLKLVKVPVQKVEDLIRGEILSHPENSVPQTIVLRYQEIGVYCVRKSEAMVLFLSKEYLDRNLTFFSMLPTQVIPDFFVAEYYGLRNTIFCGS
jgi:hypothetical protein